MSLLGKPVCRVHGLVIPFRWQQRIVEQSRHVILFA
jgi:hypothetical protein